MDTQKYLERINYAGPINVSYEVLSKLQLAHLMTVPFENLDIQNHIKIDLSNLFDKVVTRRRGGFCYELNGLFYDLLKEIGFTVKRISARGFDKKKGYSKEFDHLALVVTIEEDNYLVDVGFGEFAFCPIKIELDKDHKDPRGIFRIETLDEFYKVVKKKNADGEFVPEYKFSEKARREEEFYGMCNYHQTSPESPFVQKRICSLPTANGRITVTADILKITNNDVVTQRHLDNQKEINQVLWDEFGVKL